MWGMNNRMVFLLYACECGESKMGEGDVSECCKLNGEEAREVTACDVMTMEKAIEGRSLGGQRI
jgi:hypothetical protein